MIPIQLFGLLTALAAIHLTYLYYKRTHFTKKEVFFWVGVWGAFFLMTLFPNSLTPMVGYFGLNRSMDLIMIIGFIIVFMLVFHNYVVNRKLEKRLERLVRELTLKDVEKK